MIPIFKRILRWLLFFSIAILGIIIAGVLLIQVFVSQILQDYVQTEFGWALKIGSAQIQFHPLSIRLENIELAADHQKPFLQARSVSAFVPYSSFWSKTFRVDRFVIDTPIIDFQLMPSFKSSSDKAEKSFRIENASIIAGDVRFKDYRLEEIELESRIDSKQISIRKLNSKFQNIHLTANGTIDNLSKAELNISYSLVGNADGIASMLPAARDVKGEFVSKGTIKGELKQPIINGQVECPRLVLTNSDPFSLTAKYQYDLQKEANPLSVELNVNGFELNVVRNYWQQMPELDSIGRASIHYSGNEKISEGKAAIAIQLESIANAKRPLNGEIYSHFENGLLQIERSKLLFRNSKLITNGSLSTNGLSLNADLQSLNLNDFAFLYPKLPYAHGNYHVHANLSGRYDDINVQGNVSAQSGNSNVIATGTTRLGSKTLSFQFQGNADAATLRKFVPDLSGGEIQFEGSVEGTSKSPIVNATWNTSDFQIRRMKLQELSGEIKTVGKTMKIHAVSPSLKLQADGSYQLNNGLYQLTGNLDETPIDSVVALFNTGEIPISGNVDGNFEASGNVRRWNESTATLKLQSPEIQWKDVVVSVAETQLHLENKVIHLKTSLEAPNVQLDVSGTASLQPHIPLEITVNGKVDGAVLEKISSDWKGNGEVTLNAAVTGTTSQPKLEGKLQTENFTMNYGPDKWNVVLQKAEVNLSEQALDFDGNGKLNNSPFSANGNFPLKNANGNVHFEISDLPVSTFGTGSQITGTLKVNADLERRGFPLHEWKANEKGFRDWSGNIFVEPSNLKVGDNVLTVEHPIQLSIQNHQLKISNTRISSGDLLNLAGSGNLNLETGQLNSAVQLEARIDLLSSLKADIQSSGPLKADLQVTGTFRNPEYEGTITLNHASLRIPESPLSLEDFDLQASLKNKRLQLQTLRARSGGGTITGGGELIFGAKGSQVWFQGRNVAANYPEGLRSQIDFDLKLSSLEPDILLSGDIKVLRSFYEQQLNLRNPIIRKLLATTTQLTAEKRLKNRLKFALNISTVDDLRLKNNLALINTGGNLKLEGSFFRPKFSGALNIRPGSRVYLGGNRYDVEKASLEFYGSDFVEPNLDITLYSLQRDFETDTYYEVYLPIGGPLSDIQFKNVRSVPSLSQDQIFSLITQGTVESEHVENSRSVLQQQILSTFAGQVIAAPGTAIAKSIGLSRVQVQQEGLNSVNDPKTRLMIGKDIGSGFSLIYSFVLNDPQDQTWIASYRYGRNIIGRFIDQDDGSYTVSASHRIAFGKGSNSSTAYFNSRKKEYKPRVNSVEIRNDSPLTEKQIQDILKLEEGDAYDYWDLQDRIDDLKKELQKMDFLYSSIDVHEKENQKDVVALEIEVHVAERARMIFNGYNVEEKLLKNYLRMWRTGISVPVVQQMIQEDLLRQIQLTGCYRASVNIRSEKTDSRIIYYFDANQGPKFTSVELKFNGDDHYEPKVLQSDLSRLYPSSENLFREAIHKPSDFLQKIKMLYIQKGYLKTVIQPGSVEYSSSSEKIVRSFDINEGPISYVDTVNLSNLNSIPEQLQKQIQLAAGKIFLPDALFEDEIKIRNYYESQGYQDVSMRYDVAFSKDSSNIQIRWALNTGPIAKIASIRIEGNQSTRSDLILRQSGLKDGDLLTQQNRSLARKRLSDLGIFQQVGIETEETDVPGSYDVVLRVVESKKYEFQYGGRYNTDDNFGAEIRLTDFNFLGRAQSLSLYLRSTLDLPLFRVDYMLPVLGGFWDRTRFSIFRDETDEDVRATISGDLIKIPFTKKQITFQYQQDHSLWNSYRFFWGAEYGSLTANFEDLTNRTPVQFKGTVALFHTALLADQRDDSLNASRGYFFSVDGEYAPKLFGSDISYAKTFSQLFYYKKIGKIISATGLRIGFLAIRSNILSVAEKFRTGGSTTMRGFEYNTVVPGDDAISVFFGGDSVLILNEELRFPIHKWLSGATFVDAGNVYRTVSDFDPADLRYSAGLGLRVGTGSFLLRFDFGFNLDPEEDESSAVFHFGIGQAF